MTRTLVGASCERACTLSAARVLAKIACAPGMTAIKASRGARVVKSFCWRDSLPQKRASMLEASALEIPRPQSYRLCGLDAREELALCDGEHNAMRRQAFVTSLASLPLLYAGGIAA